jgi:hypothetical protein
VREREDKVKRATLSLDMLRLLDSIVLFDSHFLWIAFQLDFDTRQMAEKGEREREKEKVRIG